MATLRDIADQLNISVPVVSRVLNGKTDVYASEATRQRVFEVAQELGYRPSASARALVTGRTMVIAVLVEEEQVEVSQRRQLEIRGLVDAAANHGYRVLVLPLRGGGAVEQQVEHLIAEKICDGFCLFADMISEPLLHLLARRRTRCVVIGDVEVGADSPELRDLVVQVDIDNDLYARDSVGWLLAQGHEKITWVQAFGEADQPHALKLRAGYAAAMKEAGQNPHILPLLEDDEAIAAFAQSGQATAVIVRGLHSLIRWITVLRVAGAPLSQGFQLLAHLNMEELPFFLMSGQKPYAACHVYEPRAVERCAGDVLVRWIEGETPAQHHILVSPSPPGRADEVWQEFQKSNTARGATCGG